MTSNKISGSLLAIVVLVTLVSFTVPAITLAQQPPPAAGNAGGNGGANCPPGTIKLLEPIDGNHCLSTGSSVTGAFDVYFSMLFPWVVGVSAGIAILWGVAGGANMLLNAGDSGKYEEGRQWLLSSMVGLFIIIFSAMILNFLNPSFFK